MTRTLSFKKFKGQKKVRSCRVLMTQNRNERHIFWHVKIRLTTALILKFSVYNFKPFCSIINRSQQHVTIRKLYTRIRKWFVTFKLYDLLMWFHYLFTNTIKGLLAVQVVYHFIQVVWQWPHVLLWIIMSTLRFVMSTLRLVMSTLRIYIYTLRVPTTCKSMIWGEI